MYQNPDGTSQKTKSLLFIIIVLTAIVAIVGTTNIILHHQSNDIEEKEEYKDDNQNNTSKPNDKEETNEEQPETPIPPTEELPQVQETYSNIEQLSYISFQNMIKEKRSFVVVISQTYCSHCIAYKPIYNDVLKENNSKGYDLDILGLDKELRKEILDKLEVSGTPTTLIYIDGVLQKDRIEGITTKETLKSFLARYGFI